MEIASRPVEHSRLQGPGGTVSGEVDTLSRKLSETALLVRELSAESMSGQYLASLIENGVSKEITAETKENICTAAFEMPLAMIGQETSYWLRYSSGKFISEHGFNMDKYYETSLDQNLNLPNWEMERRQAEQKNYYQLKNIAAALKPGREARLIEFSEAPTWTMADTKIEGHRVEDLQVEEEAAKLGYFGAGQTREYCMYKDGEGEVKVK
ncbi:MAG: hypothetical protein ACOCXP_04485, partial [Candidatus Dojkabacteria bacterium]